MRAVLAAWDLSIPEYTTLSVLRNRPGLSNAQLARRAMITPQSMIEVLARLERRELVHRVVDPDHQRILRAQLTPSGVLLLAEADPAIDGIQDRMLAGVPARERQIALRTLMQAMDTLSTGRNGHLHQSE
jgi:DNA-binding MarR family transcriptional regulator